jgi:hypothetical protein
MFWRQHRRAVNTMITALSEFSTGTGLFHRGQNFVERHRGERCGVVGYPVGNNELPTVQQTAAGINHVWDIAFALVFVWRDERLRQAADDFGRVVTVQQEGADAIL